MYINCPLIKENHRIIIDRTTFCAAFKQDTSSVCIPLFQQHYTSVSCSKNLIASATAVNWEELEDSAAPPLFAHTGNISIKA